MRKQMEKMSCDDRGRDWSDTAAGQGTPTTDGHHHKPRGGKEGCHPQSQREHGLVSTFMDDF